MNMEKNCTNCKWLTYLKNHLDEDLPVCKHEVSFNFQLSDPKNCCCTYYEPSYVKTCVDNIRICLSNVFNTGSTMQQCDYDFINTRLDNILDFIKSKS